MEITRPDQLAFALAQGDVLAAQHLLHSGVSLTECGSLGQPAWVSVSRARCNAEEVVGFLVSSGFSLDRRDQLGNTLLHSAAHGGNRAVVRAIVRRGVPCDLASGSGLTPIAIAASSGYADLVEELLALRAIPDAGALHASMRSERWSIALRLVDAGADDARDSHETSVALLVRHLCDKRTPIRFQDRKEPERKAIEALLRAVVARSRNVLASRGVDSCPLWTAGNSGHHLLLDTLLGRVDHHAMRGAGGSTLLHHSAWWGRAECCKKLIEAGAAVNARDEYHRTPLHVAAREGHLGIAEALLRAQADINARAPSMGTPLDLAVKYRHRDVFRLLCGYGAKGSWKRPWWRL